MRGDGRFSQSRSHMPYMFAPCILFQHSYYMYVILIFRFLKYRDTLEYRITIQLCQGINICCLAQLEKFAKEAIYLSVLDNGMHSML